MKKPQYNIDTEHTDGCGINIYVSFNIHGCCFIESDARHRKA